jgi:hypothetical protein
VPFGGLVPPPLPPPQTPLAAQTQCLTDGGNNAPLVLSAQTDAAITFFNSERTPATLLCIMALNGLFMVPLKPGVTPLVGGINRLYIFLAGMALSNALISVFMASLAIVKLLDNRHNAIARSAIDMMHREIPFFLFAVRAHFVTAILFLSSALAARMWLEIRIGCPPFSRGMSLLLGSSVLFMLHLFNSSALTPSYGAMLIRYFQHYLRHISTPEHRGPCIYGAVILALCAVREFCAMSFSQL